MKKTSLYNYNGNKCEQCQKDITRNARLCRHCSKQIYDKILTKSCHMKTNQYRGLWKKYLSLLVKNKLPTREMAIQSIKKVICNKDIIISSLGMTSRTVEEILKSNNHLPLVGGMGGALAIAIGIALNTKKKVWVILGDGESLMGLGSFVMANKLHLKNLGIFVLDNNCHASTGGQKTCSDAVDFERLAPNTKVIKVSPGKGDAPRIPLLSHKIKERFQNAIKT